MAQIVRTTSGAVNTGVWTSSEIAALRAKIAAGQPISASDINKLIAIVNAFYSHYHTASDQFWAAYGNTSPYATTVVADQTSAVLPLNPGGYTNAVVGDSITAANVNAVINALNTLRTHYHTINDGWY